MQRMSPDFRRNCSQSIAGRGGVRKQLCRLAPCLFVVWYFAGLSCGLLGPVDDLRAEAPTDVADNSNSTTTPRVSASENVTKPASRDTREAPERPSSSRIQAPQPQAKVVRANDQAAEAVAARLPTRGRSPAEAAEQMIQMRGWHLPGEVSESDQKLRLLLLAPGGPILLEVRIGIDQKTFRSHRDGLIDHLLEVGDLDEDGKVAWKELATAPRLGRIGSYAQRMSANFDFDQDDVADARELRYMYAYMSGGAALNFPPTYAGFSDPLLHRVLDANQDGALDAAELADAATQLNVLDTDDNDVLSQQELVGNTVYGPAYRPTPARRSALRHLTSDVDWSQLHADLTKRYGDGESLVSTSFGHTPKLFDRLDQNGDNALTADELRTLLRFPPHLQLVFHFGQRPKSKPPLEVLAISRDLKLTDHALSGGGRTLRLAFDPILVTVEAPVTPPYLARLQDQGKRLIQLLDKDKNGYIDRNEVKAQRGYAAQFDQWDADGDDKVYEQEITDAYTEQNAPRLNQVSLSAAKQPRPLLAIVDSNGDGVLGLREMWRAGERLKPLDANGDKRLTLDEVPTSLRMVVSRGPYTSSYQARQSRALRVNRPTMQRPSPSVRGPEWFTNMDRNGDGDVSRREFVGTSAQFAKLDRDQDALIDRNEAERATSQDDSPQKQAAPGENVQQR